MSQNDLLISHMMKGKTVSRLEALHNWNIQNITARIRDIRAKGIDVKATIKTDPRGGEYADYSINWSEREMAIFLGRVIENPGGDYSLAPTALEAKVA